MGVILNPILSSTAGTSRAYNPGIAETFSWIPVEGDSLGRPLYARASYITNFSDMHVSLTASELSIGAVTIKDNNSGVNADVITVDGYGSGLVVHTQNLSSIENSIAIGDSQGNVAAVNSFLSALNVNIAGYQPLEAEIQLKDSPNLDAFGRLRVSEPKTLLDAKHLYDKLPLLFKEKINGAASSNFSSGDSMVVMSTNNQNDYVIRQTTYRFNYQPGKSIQAFFTGKLTPEPGIVKRMGLYQSLSSAPTTPVDGMYFEVNEHGPFFNIIKSEGLYHSMSIPQSAWNVDKLDGTGPSGLTVAMSAAQIFVIDYEWLSLGRVRFGFMLGGKTHYAHYVNHINDLDRPYITSPNQPVRYEIIQTGATPGSMHHICSTVMIEGGEEDIGKPITVADGIVQNVGSNNYSSLLAIKINKDLLNSVVILKAAEVLNVGGNSAVYDIILNPSYVSTPFVWSNIPDTAVQYSTGGAEVSGGYSIFKSFVAAGLGGSTMANALAIPGEIARLGADIDGKPDVIVIAGKTLVSPGTTDLVCAATLLERF